MITQLLQEIRDFLKKVLGKISEQIDAMKESVDRMEETVEDIAETDAAILDEVKDIDDTTKSIKDTVESIKGDTDKLNNIDTTLTDTYGELVAFHTDSDTLLTEIKNTGATISSNVADIKVKSTNIDSNVTAMRNNSDVNSRYIPVISQNCGKTAEFSEDIATNTLESANKLTAISADTTEIIALLRQILEEVKENGRNNQTTA